MIEAALPENELERLDELRGYDVLDTRPERAFDDLTLIASRVADVPIALVSLVDQDRQWFKSKQGLSACETPRKVAFCSHAILRPESVMVVPDATQDPRFHDNPIVVGEPRVIFYAGAPLVTPSGVAVGTLCLIDHKPREITDEQKDTLSALARQVVSQLELRKRCSELRDLSEQLARSNRELEDFTRIAAHDLQEPLRKMISFSNLLESDLGSDLPERAVQDINYITCAATRMQRLIQDLLKLSRAGTAPVEAVDVPLSQCVEQAVDNLSLRVEETGAAVSAGALPSMMGDPTLLTLLFQNLIGNALKFVKDKPPIIKVTSAIEDGRVVVGVKDNGIGIDPKYAEQVFVPFRRLHGRREFEGTGIGLAITRKVVERHGGGIWVESAPGMGSHFKFTLGPEKVEHAAAA